MEKIGIVTYFLFYGALLFTFIFLAKAAAGNRKFLLVITGWIVLQSVLGLSGFYTQTSGIPPRFIVLIPPALVAIALLFILPRGRLFLDTLDGSMLTLLHVARIPVEMMLFQLAVAGTVPYLMTFKGVNFDIFSGLTALIIYGLGYRKKVLGKSILLLWNFACLVLLLNVVVRGVLSVPTPFQQLAFDQPNIALMYFPFLLLPGFIVPTVLFSHLVVIRNLLKK